MSLGHVDWTIALVFGLGLLPGSLAGSLVSERIPARVARPLFGVALVAFATWFLIQPVAPILLQGRCRE